MYDYLRFASSIERNTIIIYNITVIFFLHYSGFEFASNKSDSYDQSPRKLKNFGYQNYSQKKSAQNLAEITSNKHKWDCIVKNFG